MGKIFTIIGIVYVLYYAANIIYDLFFKKDKTVSQDDSEVFSIGDLAEEYQEPVQNVSIDDVENLKTPHSYNSKPFDVTTNGNETADTELWRKRFEEEQNIDNYPSVVNTQNNVSSTHEYSNSTTQTSSKNDAILWQELLNQAETQVQVVDDIEGYKVYKTVH